MQRLGWLGLVLCIGCGGGDDASKPPADSQGEKIDAAAAEKLRREQEEAAKRIESAPEFTETFQHPCGLYFMVPKGWTIQGQSDNAVALQPPDPAMHQGQPAEAVLVVGTDAQGISDPADPRAVAQADEFVAAVFPFLAKSGESLSWSGRSPTGLDAAGRMRLSIQGGYLVGLFVICPKDVLAKREPVARDMFRTFGFKKPESDPRLAGKWMWEDTYVSGTFSMVTVKYLFLFGDGTCGIGGKMAGGMQHTDGGGNYAGDSSLESGGRGIDKRGKWYTQGSRIVINWEDGVGEAWNFTIEGDSMLFREGDAKKLWTRRR